MDPLLTEPVQEQPIPLPLMFKSKSTSRSQETQDQHILPSRKSVSSSSVVALVHHNKKIQLDKN